MKEKIIGAVFLFAVIGFVIANTIILDRQVEQIACQISSLDITDEEALEHAVKYYENYRKKEQYISLTVSHNDLTNIEDYFVEMIGHLTVRNLEDAQVTKDRLISSLEHLRRLSGFTVDAII